jgi:hypothetical protein
MHSSHTHLIIADQRSQALRGAAKPRLRHLLHRSP